MSTSDVGNASTVVVNTDPAGSVPWDVFNDHVNDISNPHKVTAAQVGASNPAININPDFQVNNHGTSFSNPSQQYTSNRWMSYTTGNGGTLPNITHTIFTNDATILDDIVCRFYRMNFDGSGSNLGSAWQVGIRQVIESGTRKYCGTGKTLTLSFYARSNIPNKKMSASFYQSYGSGGSPSANEYSTPSSFNLSSSWQKCVVTIDTYTLNGKTFGTNLDDTIGIITRMGWGLSTVSGWPTSEPISSGYVDIANVKLEQGSVATPFVPRSLAEELELCHRYFQENGAVGYGFAITGNKVTGYFPLCGTLRALPTLTFGGTCTSSGNVFSNGYAYPITGASVVWITDNMIRIDVSYSGTTLPNNTPVLIDFNNDFLLDSEIY